MGEVWRARDVRLDREVAVKVLPDDVAQEPDRLRRFQTEAEAAARLKHTNIAVTHTVEEVNGYHFITMEYVKGQPLDALIPKGGLALDRFFQWFIPLADAPSQATFVELPLVSAP